MLPNELKPLREKFSYETGHFFQFPHSTSFSASQFVSMAKWRGVISRSTGNSTLEGGHMAAAFWGPTQHTVHQVRPLSLTSKNVSQKKMTGLTRIQVALDATKNPAFRCEPSRPAWNAVDAVVGALTEWQSVAPTQS